MKYKNYYDLPGPMRRIFEKWKMNTDELNSWINKPISALDDRSVLQALNDGDEEKVRNVIFRVTEMMGVTD